MSATLRLDTHHHVGPVDRRIFGGFAEHLGRCIYEGIYDPGNAHGLVDAEGFRTDVIAALKPLGMPIMRYPGGNFVSCYDWRDGVGPRADRPVRRDFAWRSLESNQFGTDEFLRWCKLADTQPMMAVNLGTAGAAEAAALLEYCNAPTGSAWSDLRKSNGSVEPYGVKLWCLGNEMDGPWQAGHVPAAEYGRRARAAGAMMKGNDPTIETVACGSSAIAMPTYLAYDRETLEIAWDSVDYVSAHRYSTNARDDTAWFLAEGVEIDRVLEDYAGLLDYLRGVKKTKKRVFLSFDEWNVWYRTFGGASVNGEWHFAPHLLEEWYDLQDALVCAQYLNAFIRRADLVKIACIAQIVNVIAPIMTRPEGLLLQTIYHPIAAMSRAVKPGCVSLRVALDSPSYKAGERGEVPAIDASAVFDPTTGVASVFLVNREGEATTTSLGFADRTVVAVKETTQVADADPKAANTWAAPERVKPTTAKVTLDGGGVRVELPAYGFVAVTVETTAR